MPRNRLLEIIGSLRFRLTLWNVATFLVMILFTLWAVREGVRYTLRREADEQLLEDDGIGFGVFPISKAYLERRRSLLLEQK